jgi:segregation and condensation protein B
MVKKKKDTQSVLKKPNKPEQTNLRRNVEAILFAAGKALELKFIAELCNTIPSQIKKQLVELQKEYSTNVVLMIVDQDTTWKMTVREQYLPMVSKIVADTELSKSELETLSMIAFRSPALQSDVVKARGVVTYDHVAELVRLGFVVKNRVGRSYVLKLTEKFYEYFEIDGKKIREVFQPVKDNVDEQLELGNTNLPKNEAKPKDIFDKTQEERLGDLEVYREENQKHAEKINELRDAHKEFLGSIDKEIDDISKRTDVEEKEIESVRTSQVQDKIEAIKSGDLGEGNIESSEEEDEVSKMLEKTEKEINDLVNDSNGENND